MVFFDWELVYTCNYRCSYCYYTSSGWDKQYHLNVFPGLPRLTQVWERMYQLYGPCHIQIAGGECSTYPRFYEFMEMMLARHTVTMVTNLSFDVRLFASKVDLKRMFIGASFHPQFSDSKIFLEKCNYLKEKGIANLFVNYVAYPDQLPRMAEYKTAFNNAGIEMYVDPFTGVYKKDIPYPGGYTEQEKALINDTFVGTRADSRLSAARFAWGGSPNESGAAKLVKQYQAEREDKGETPRPPQKDPGVFLGVPWEKSAQPVEWSDLAFGSLEAKVPAPQPEPAGPVEPCRLSRREPVLCRQGQKYAKVRANGDAFRCCAQLREDQDSPLFAQTVYLGNMFLDDNFRLLEEAKLCDYEPCPCDRCMVVGEEARWEDRWKAPATA